MNRLVTSPLDTSQEAMLHSRMFSEMVADDLLGPNASQCILGFHDSYTKVSRYVADSFRELLKGNERDLTKVAGRLKYVTGNLQILEVCGRVAAINDGMCREIARTLMGKIHGDVECLKHSLEDTKVAAEAADPCAAQVRKAMEAIEAGDCEEVDPLTAD